MLTEPTYTGPEVAVALGLAPREFPTLRNSDRGPLAIPATNGANGKAQRWSLLDACKLDIIHEFGGLTFTPAARRALYDFLTSEADNGRLAIEGALQGRPRYLVASTAWEGWGTGAPTPGFGTLRLHLADALTADDFDTAECHTLALHKILPEFRMALESRRTHGLTDED